MHSAGFMIPDFSFPLLAGGGDWFGIIFFIVIAILSSLGKKGGADEETPTRPVRRVPPRMPGESEGSDELADQMRRYLDQARAARQQQSSRQASLPPPPRAASPRQSVTTVIRRSFSSPPVPVASPDPVAVVMEEDIHQEGPQSGPLVHRQASGSIATSLSVSENQADYALQESLEVSHPISTSASVPLTASSFDFDMTLLRSPCGLRQALVVSEILGRPRALTL